MLKVFKKTIKYFFVLILILFVAVISLPFLFKDKIKAKLLTEIDKNIDAKVNFTDLSFSSFKKFPHVTVSLHNPTVIGVGEFAGDTLVDAKEISISFDLYSIIKGHSIEINGK